MNREIVILLCTITSDGIRNVNRGCIRHVVRRLFFDPRFIFKICIVDQFCLNILHKQVCLNVLKLPLDYRSTSWSQTSYWRSSEVYWAAAWSWCILLLACWLCRFFYILTLLVSFEFLSDISWVNFIANSDPSSLFGDDFQRAQSRFRQVGNQIRRVRNQIRRPQKSDLYICHCVRPSFIQTCLSNLILKAT